MFTRGAQQQQQPPADNIERMAAATEQNTATLREIAASTQQIAASAQQTQQHFAAEMSKSRNDAHFRAAIDTVSRHFPDFNSTQLSAPVLLEILERTNNACRQHRISDTGPVRHFVLEELLSDNSIAQRALASASVTDFDTADGGPLLPPIFGKLATTLCLRLGNPEPNSGEPPASYWRRLCAMYEQMTGVICPINLVDLLQEHYAVPIEKVAALTTVAYQDPPPQAFRTTTATIVQHLDATFVHQSSHQPADVDRPRKNNNGKHHHHVNNKPKSKKSVAGAGRGSYEEHIGGTTHQSTAPDQIERLAGITSTNNQAMPTVDVRIHGRRQLDIKAGADSQASVDAIDLETARAAQLPIVENKKPSIASATGTPLAVAGVVRYVWLVANGKRHQLRDVRVLTNLFAPLVLGAASLGALGISLVPSATGLTAAPTRPSPAHKFASPADELFDKIDTTNLSSQQIASIRGLCRALDKAELVIGKESPGRRLPLAVVGAQHDIRLRANAKLSNVWRPAPPRPAKRQAVVDAFFDELEHAGFVKTLPPGTQSDVQLLPLLVPKYDPAGNVSGERVTIDARQLNDETDARRHDIPLIPATLVAASRGARRSVADLSNFYLSIPLAAGSQHLSTTAVSPTRRVQWLRMPPGLVDAHATALSFIERALATASLPAKAYIDDISWTHNDGAAFVAQFREFVNMCLRHNITVNAAKSRFNRVETTLLGHTVGPGYYKPLASRIAALDQMRTPRTREELLRILGLVRVYSSFVPRINILSAPLAPLTRPHGFAWSGEAQTALDACLDAVRNHATLAAPVPGAPFVVSTDASGEAVGYVIEQIVDGKPRAIRFGGRRLAVHERAPRRTVPELEVTAIVTALKDNRDLLFDGSSPVTVQTDNQTAAALMRMPLENKKAALRAAVDDLQALPFSVKHVPSTSNLVADALSRQVDFTDRIAALVTDDNDDDDDSDNDSDANNGALAHALAAEDDFFDEETELSAGTIPPPDADADLPPTATPALASAQSSAPPSPPHQTQKPAEPTAARAPPPAAATADTSAQRQPKAPANPPRPLPPPQTDAPPLGAPPMSEAQALQLELRNLPKDKATTALVAQQADDPSLAIYRDAASNNTDVQGMRPYLDKYGVLRVANQTGRSFVVAPTCYREELAHAAHDGTDGGHHGPALSVCQAEACSWWPGQADDVKRVVDACMLCKTRKAQKPNSDLGVQPHHLLRAEAVQMDAVPMPKPGKTDFAGFFIVACCATGMTNTIPVTDFSADSAVHALKAVVAQWDIPRFVEVDQGRTFTSEAFRAYLASIGSQLVVHSAHNHGAQGIAEWRVGVIKRHLLTAFQATRRPWHLALHDATRSVNVAPSLFARGGLSAFELFHGTPPILAAAQRLFGNVARYRQAKGEPAVPATPAEQRAFSSLVGDNVAKLGVAAAAARQRSIERNQRHRRVVGQSRDDVVVGAYVLLDNNDKTAPTKWQNIQRQSGPYVVAERNDRRARLVRTVNGSDAGWVSVNRLQAVEPPAVETPSPDTLEPGAAGWTGRHDPRLLLPAEQAVVAKQQQTNSLTRPAASSIAAQQSAADAALAARQAAETRLRIARINALVPDDFVALTHLPATAARPELLVLGRSRAQHHDHVTISHGHPRWREFLNQWQTTKSNVAQ